MASPLVAPIKEETDHRVMEAGMKQHPVHEIPAVFARREDAEAAVDELYSEHLAGDHLWRAVRSSNHQARENDTDRTVFHNVAAGVAIGLPLGMLTGALLFYVGALIAGVQPAVGDIVLGGAFGGFMGGAFFGIVTGVARSYAALYGREPYGNLDLGAEEILVVARCGGADEHVREVLTEHGGRVVEVARAA
jgi:hypothetical protein